ncbi:MAG: tRNA pseudouridine(55) synthase TruB, partial [Acutalibacteraceae bacterium]|nr:tRNA pseudouridine(55) synthase TruB [Acutalibacteraceae bacterium]
KLGVATDTEDITGNIISETKVSVTDLQLEAALKLFTGKIMQMPPMYSAIKKDGVRLYKLAREGKTAEVEAREIEIFSISLISPLNNQNVFEIDVHASKGTYIRSLARDIGEHLGCGACLTELRRTYTGGFSIEDCVSLDTLNEKNITEHIISEERAVAHLREVLVTEKQAVRFCNGGQLDLERLKIKALKNGELVRVKLNDKFLGVGFADLEKNQLAIKCIINKEEGL